MGLSISLMFFWTTCLSQLFVCFFCLCLCLWPLLSAYPDRFWSEQDRNLLQKRGQKAIIVRQSKSMPKNRARLLTFTAFETHIVFTSHACHDNRTVWLRGITAITEYILRFYRCECMTFKTFTFPFGSRPKTFESLPQTRKGSNMNKETYLSLAL